MLQLDITIDIQEGEVIEGQVVTTYLAGQLEEEGLQDEPLGTFSWNLKDETPECKLLKAIYKGKASLYR